MKKIIFITGLIFICLNVNLTADAITMDDRKNAEEIIYYDVFKHEDTASLILMSWGGISIGAGAAMSTSGNNITRAIGMQSIIWGGVDTAFGLWMKNILDDKKKTVPYEKEQEWFKNLLGTKLLVDIGCIAVGGAMTIWGNEDVQGHGIGIMSQSLFLLAFDGINFMMGENLQKRFPEAKE